MSTEILHKYQILDYREALRCQRELYQSAIGEGFFGFSVPKPIVTMGLGSKRAGEVNDSPFVSLAVDRGGASTLHAPGQLVLFPIWRLRPSEKGIKDRLCLFHKNLQAGLRKLYGIETALEDPTGLYTASGKISFSGLRVKQSQVFHGFSINVCNCLELFSSIRSCGVLARNHDSLACHTKSVIDPARVFSELSPFLNLS